MNKEIKITTKGTKVIATLFEDGKYLRHAIANPYYTDEYNYEIGVRAAVDKLFGGECGKKKETKSKVKEVKKKAVVGDYVKLISNGYVKYKGKYYIKGSIFKIIEDTVYDIENSGYERISHEPGGYLSEREYVVLDGYTPNPNEVVNFWEK